MAKRFQPMKDLARAKKPKLDFSISRGRADNNNASSSSKCPFKAPSSPPRTTAIDFWNDDEDDDVILLATQRAEAAAVHKPEVIVITETEMAFSEFAPQMHGTTSTQMFPAPAAKSTNSDIDALFGNDDDFDFLAVAIAERKSTLTEPATNKQEQAPASGSCNNSIPVLSQNETTASARRQLAQERQMKFLMERVDALKKDNMKLQKDLGDTKDRIENKDGEASLLRDELRHLRQQLQASKMEKLKLAETAKAECNTKVAEVIKQVTAKETELKLKDVEVSRLKMRHTIETRQFEMSMCEDDSTSVLIINAEARRNMLRLQNLTIDSTKSESITANTAKIYKYNTKGIAKGKKEGVLFQLELEQLLLNYAQLQAQPSTMTDISARIIESVCKVFLEFWSYAHSLEFSQNCVLYPYHGYKLETDHSAETRQSLNQPQALYELERGISLRRYLATLALICRQEAHIAHSLLHHKHGQYWLLQIANDAIAKLGYSDELCEHFGVLEAAAALLHSLLVHGATAVPQLDLLFDLLKQLVFTRPSPWIFRQLCASMLVCLREPQLMAHMCVNSGSDCFISDRMQSLYRFGPDSCLLQVHAGLLELAFYSEVALEAPHFELLLTICSHHVRFVYQCFSNPPDFILEMLPSLADEDEPTSEETTNGITLSNSSTAAAHGSTTTGSSRSPGSLQPPTAGVRSCECYVKLCLSVVTLVFQMLHQWMLHDRKIAASQQVGDISQMAVHLFTLIFREYYLTELFRESEETTKHYLALICNWWAKNAQTLRFQDIHMRFLRNLQDSHFMIKPLHEESNPDIPNRDLLEWTRIVKNADANVQKYVNPDDPFNCYHLSSLNTCKFFDGLKRCAYDFE